MSELALVLPKVETEAATNNFGCFSISPLEPGYGVTLGNTLRRVLLASLKGAAVSSVRISGVHHEFSHIPNVREDMTALILNLKQLRVKLHQNESARLRVEVRGEGPVTAGDLEAPPYVDIINPDLYLFSGDSGDTELDIELLVEVGRGYSPAEERGKLPIGEIPIDAIFSPVRKANFKVERARVGQATDYDKLVMEVSTDGTISPYDALREAAHLLVKHFSLVASITAEEEPEEEPEEETATSKMYDTPIEELELTVRAYNCLKRAGITQVGEILEKLRKGPDEILAVRNFGQKSLDELIDRLEEKELLIDIDESIIVASRSGS
ncbi:MAG: DNA-directed RNA polymerase subunit alpha [Anaerolineae bacterium]